MLVSPTFIIAIRHIQNSNKLNSIQNRSVQVMASEAVTSSILVLRIFTLLALVASVVAFVINSITVIVDIRNLAFEPNGVKYTFKDVITYRYVISAAVIGAAYTIFQLPFALCHVCTGKRMISNECMPEFDIIADEVVSYLLASGAGAGFAVSVECKSFLKDMFNAISDPTVPAIEQSKSSYEKFLDRGIIATALLSLGFLCMAAVSVLSSISARKERKGFFS